jgi:hypothetical protein
MLLNNTKVYIAQAMRLALNRYDCFVIGHLVKYFSVWRKSLDANSNCLTDRIPWICFAAIDFLDKLLTKDMRVYEFGSGGSTLFFANRVKEVISVEHDPEWFKKVFEKVSSETTNCTVLLYEPEADSLVPFNNIADPEAYISEDENYRGKTFKKYASSIDGYPDEYFDIILIDGRARPSCCKHSIAKIKRGGYLILDNAERQYYSYVHTILNAKKWQKVDFFGPLPNVQHFSETCLWQKI